MLACLCLCLRLSAPASVSASVSMPVPCVSVSDLRLNKVLTSRDAVALCACCQVNIGYTLL